MTLGQLKKRVRYWQHTLYELGLIHWSIDVEIVDEPARRYEESPAVASVSSAAHYDTAWMEFSKEWLAESDELHIDKTIIHELLHVALRDLEQYLEEPKDWMPPATFHTWSAAMNHEQEGFIERISRAIAGMHHDD
jgi:hypothetical protein